MAKHYPTVLSIAGSDSIGGAGIQADIKTCCAHGVYAMTAITAVTAQNTLGVDGYEPVSASLLKAQLDAIAADVKPDSVKIGMVPSDELREVIADWLEENRQRNVILDPVMVATSGHSLADNSNYSCLIDRLMPLCTLLTPNLPEARRLFEAVSTDAFSIEKAGNVLSKKSPFVLIKGGHGTDSETLVDTLFHDGSMTATFSHPKIDTRNTHGTGCSLSSAIACYLALGSSIQTAVARGIKWLQKALEHGSHYEFGHGHGPVCHNFLHDK